MIPQTSAAAHRPRPAPAAPRAAEAGAELSRVAFDTTGLYVGMRLFIKPRSTTSDTKYQSALIGWEPGQGLFARMPLDGMVPMTIMNGETVDVRLFTGTAALLFSAEVLRANRSPLPHLVLSYPPSVYVAALRSADRVAVDIAGSLHAASQAAPGDPMLVRVRDLSAGGALIEHPTALPAVAGDKVTLKLDLGTMSGRRRTVELHATVRSLRTPSDPANPVFHTGLQFDPLDEVDELWVECATQAARLKAGMRAR